MKDFVIALPHAVAEPITSEKLPDVFDRVEFRRVGRQRQKGYVRRDDQAFGWPMPAGAIDLQQAVGARCHIAADDLKMLAHGFKVDGRHHDPGAYATGRAHRAEQIGPGIAAIAWCRRTTATLGPHPGERALLTNPGLILPPDFERFAGCFGRQGSGNQASEVFLCVSWQVLSCSGWNGRTDSLRNDNLASSLPTLRS